MAEKTCLITGGSRGIGLATALRMARGGYDIAITARGEDDLLKAAEEIKATGVRCESIVADVSEPGDAQRIIKEAQQRLGRIDVLVNNAGVAPLERLDILETTEDSFQRLMDINLEGPFFLTQAVANQMIRQVRQGAEYAPTIVFVTSISSYTASPSRAEYCISKAGLSMAAQNFAVRLAEFGINVYDVQPGIIATDMTSAVTEKYDKLIEEGLLLQKRWGTPEDVGKAVVALAEGCFEYATGAAIEVGGGFGLRRL